MSRSLGMLARALGEFMSGNFSFSGNVSAIAITPGASASTGTESSTVGASGGKKEATTAGGYQKGRCRIHDCQRRTHVRSLGGRPNILLQCCRDKIRGISGMGRSE